jgi:hypothetical protein
MLLSFFARSWSSLLGASPAVYWSSYHIAGTNFDLDPSGDFFRICVKAMYTVAREVGDDEVELDMMYEYGYCDFGKMPGNE